MGRVMQWMNDNWVITPAGGVTGAAYVARTDNEKLFLKRNSSPFLAVLSAEGIVPQLLWAKRLENGDVITAQKWMEGRELKAEEMNSKRVARLLKKIHGSNPLLLMLSRLGKEPLTPKSILQSLMAHDFTSFRQGKAALSFLCRAANHVVSDSKVVCHSDTNHNNWLLDKEDQLYLIDWDHAVIADPALDLGITLYWYIKESEWAKWLKYYGLPLTSGLRLRLHWYAIARTLLFVFWHKEQGRDEEARFHEKELARFLRLGERL